MDHLKKAIDDGLRKVRGKIELVKRPHVSVKEWLSSQISASASFLSATTLNEDKSDAGSTSTYSSGDTVECSPGNAEYIAKPSSLFSMNNELLEIFDCDDGVRMKIILNKGFDPNYVDGQGKPLIYRAVEDQKYSIIETMLEFGFGCDVDSTCQCDSEFGWSSLHLAAYKVDLKAVELLLGVNLPPNTQRDVCDVNAVDVNRRLALHLVCSDVIIPSLTSNQHNQMSLHNKPKGVLNHSKVTAASNLIPNEHDARLRLDSSDGAMCGDVASSSQQMASGKSVTAQVMKLLINAGSHVNMQDINRSTPLHICAGKGDLDSVKVLLRNGADIDLVDDKCETPLVKAILAYHSQIVRALLKMEHSISDIKRYELSETLCAMFDSYSPVLEQKVIEIIKMLLKKRVYLNVTDCRSRTPLHLAVLHGCHGVALTLIREPTCDITLGDGEGFSPLFLSAWNPKKLPHDLDNVVILELIRTGADVNHTDTSHVYPINAALESGQFINTCILLAHGSHVDSALWFCSSLNILRWNESTLPFVQRFIISMKNNYRHTPLLIEVATILGQMSIVDTIIKCGAKCRDLNLGRLRHWIENESQDYVANELLSNVGLLSMQYCCILDLKDLCRVTIRSRFKTRLHENIDRLPLPEVLKKFVKMDNFWKAGI